MPNPHRLYCLIELREAAGLSQADMAVCCGLQGNQSRKTVSAWEIGEAIPRAGRRSAFLRYLWHDLGLHQNPALFAETWTILVEEWEWEPLHDSERERLSTMILSPLSAIADGGEKSDALLEPVAAGTTIPPLAVDLTVVPTIAVAVEPPALPDAQPSSTISIIAEHWPRWRVLWVKRHWIFIAITLLCLWSSVYFWRVRGKIESSPTPTNVKNLTAATTPPSASVGLPQIAGSQPVASGLAQDEAERNLLPPVLMNGGFDQPDHFAGWQLYEECDYQIVTDETLAQSGDRYLSIQNRRPRCYSFQQDLYTPLTVGVTYRAAIWLRSPMGHTRHGRFTLWALAGAPKERNEISFAVDNTAWTCLETALTIQKPEHTQLRIELYLDSHDGFDYHFDSAVLSQGEKSLCPAPLLAIVDLQLVQPSGRIYPGATVGVQTLVKNVGATDLPYETFVRYWVAEAEQGGPIDPGASRRVPVPPLVVGESAMTMHMDVYLPLNLPADRPYFLVADVAATDHPDDFTPGFDRAARSFSVTPCSQGTLYCDVPADHWAATEIQAWFDAGISQSCRSNTEPFLNRPFCPDGVVQRWMIVFFLLRRMEGKDYQPTNVYQGLFEDVPEDFEHQGALWIEALTTQRVDMRSDACPPRGEHSRFCPRDPLRRVDFARALLELRGWDLTAVEGTLFADMAAGSTEARAAEYMAHQGYLPANDTDCPDRTGYRRFCPDAPLRRASAAVMMSRALGLTKR